jgi:hypothetical protein
MSIISVSDTLGSRNPPFSVRRAGGVPLGAAAGVPGAVAGCGAGCGGRLLLLLRLWLFRWRRLENARWVLARKHGGRGAHRQNQSNIR